MRYEIPELSERFGCYVTATTLSRAKRIARKHGATAIWEVSGDFIPLLVGSIYGFDGEHWVVIEDKGVCTCGRCSGLH